MIRFSHLLIVCPALFFAACVQKDLDTLSSGLANYCDIDVDYDQRWHVVSDEAPDWQSIWNIDDFFVSYESLVPDVPDGLRALVYHDNGKYDTFNLPPFGGVIETRPGNHSLLMFNNDTEYIIFNDIKHAADALATTRVRSRSSFLGSPFVDPDVNDNTITPPDMLYACYGGDFVAPADGETISLHFQLRPLVYKYLLRYHFDFGLHHVSMARGAFAGMASAVFLTDGRTSKDAATLLFDIDSKDSFVFLDADSGKGVITTVLCSFGVPDYPNDYYTRSDYSHALNLEVLLKNGKTKNFDFDVSESVRCQPRGGVIDVYGLCVSDEEAQIPDNPGSFDVSLDSWGDYIEIPFM